MKKIISLLIFAGVSVSLFAQGNLSELVQQTKPSIFSITTYDKSGNPLAYGTGFFISSEGIGISNYHVFEGAATAIIKTLNGDRLPINKVIADNKSCDLIKFQIANPLKVVFPFLKLSETKPTEGESVFVIGNPEGLEYTVTNGIVSSVRYEEGVGQTIQTTAPISEGNSGSPLLNMQGMVIGITSFTLVKGQNLNFAMSVSNLFLLNPVDALIFPEAEIIETPVSEKSFRRFSWGSSIKDVMSNEKLTLDDKHSFQDDYYLDYLTSIQGINISAEYSFQNNSLYRIWYSPKYCIKRKQFDLCMGTSDANQALSDCSIIEGLLEELIGDNFKNYSSELFDYNDRSMTTLTKSNRISKDFSGCLILHSEFYISHTWEVKSNDTKYELILFKMKTTDGQPYYDWRLQVSKLT